MNRIVYLGSASTTPVEHAVIKEMHPYMDIHYGNASSMHQNGRKSRTVVEDAPRKSIFRIDDFKNKIDVNKALKHKT